MPGFPEAAGVVADDGQVLVTNRGSASLAWVDASKPRNPRGVRHRPQAQWRRHRGRASLAIAACIGDETHAPSLRASVSTGASSMRSTCRDNRAGASRTLLPARVFLAIREPSMVLVARLPGLDEVQHWNFRSAARTGSTSIISDGRLYVACDDAAVVEVDAQFGRRHATVADCGGPDVTFFNPATGLVHVAIGKPGLVQSIDPRSGASAQTMTSPRAHTTAIVAPDTLYVFAPSSGEALVFQDA